MNNRREINNRTMLDTEAQCRNVEELANSIQQSIAGQKIFWEKDEVPSISGTGPEKIILSETSSFEAAKKYAGKKVAVLSFGNNHSVGGSPFGAGDQEESLCHRSTLYPCLLALKESFYDKHMKDFRERRLSFYGNDDILFTPGVTVFKEGNEEPSLLDKEEWFSVDVITSSAPNIKREMASPDKLRTVFLSRIKKILDIASSEGEEYLILGAFGCGAAGNPPRMVAEAFKSLLPNYGFKVVEFAFKPLWNGDNPNYVAFKNVFEGE